MGVVYIKYSLYENGIIYTKQKVCSVIHKDQHDNVTVKMYNNDIKDYEIRVLREGQYSTTAYLMDFD
jgi:hypothetical protein